MLKFYNTLTKKIEEFVPINPQEVRMYICGPTVYDYFHIGNARTFIMSDIIRKYLEFRGYNVKYVMNLTDIDDKLIKKSHEENKPFEEIARKYSEAFFEDIKKLRIKEATLYPRATQHIDLIINMIEKLIDNGVAYNVDGNVFYDVAVFKAYGKLSGKNIDELEAGSRVEINESKNNPLDFALWKKAKEGEPYWESPWGKGRPGWHIECSAMSCKHLGETFDIHAGGNDLIFPHHEKPFVKYWMHFGFLNINKEKMSKSLGNFFTARDVLEKYSPEAIRLFFSQAHYRGPVDFNNELLDAAEKGLEKLNNLKETINFELKRNRTDGIDSGFDCGKFEQRFIEAMDEDFNTSQAVAIIFDFVKEINKTISEKENLNVDFYKKVRDFLSVIANDVLGIMNFKSASETRDASFENKLIDLLIDIRLKAKKDKNFSLSDEIRDRLGDIGVTLKDTKEGTTYSKKS
jgi:cysteinyl-tRNA synthetase